MIEVKVPELPESVSDATLINWYKKVGDFVNKDENLIDLETDKVILELPAPESGVITEILELDGATVLTGQLLAKIDTTQTQSITAENTEKSVTEKKQSAKLDLSNNSSNFINNDNVNNVLAMPAANKIANDKDIDLNQISGSGKGGRILKEDVLNISSINKDSTLKEIENKIFATFSPPKVQAPTINIIDDRPVQKVPMSRLRQKISQRLIQSQSENAILTTFNEVNLKEIINLRGKYKDKFLKEHGIKLGFMSFFVKATVMALKKFPILNASIDSNDIVYHGYFDIGIAVSSDRGLIVPIIRNADQLSLAEIEAQISDYAKKAQAGKLSLEELTGGTFSITNGGTFGSMMSTPIINPPQSAILGMHSIKDRAIVENGQIVICPMMYLALSYDHRIIDGKEAVLTLVTIKEMLEDPSRLILDI